MVVQHAKRDIIGRCIYGVDLNPMAVELCKVSLWMEALDPGRPLSFLDHHIQCGNSLLGTTPALLKQGIPDDAFNPIEGDVKAVCTDLKKRNKRERADRESGQGYLFESYIKLGNLPSEFTRLSSDGDDSVAAVDAKAKRYAELVSGADYLNARLLADTWCATFVWKKDTSDLGKLCPTERDFRNIEDNPYSVLPHVKAEVRSIADQYRFFHWHLAFPDVFRVTDIPTQNEKSGCNDGFSAILGNPPWERIKLQEKEWFAGRVPEIANAPTAAIRREMIKSLATMSPPICAEFSKDRRTAEGGSHFVRNSGRYPLCGRGDVNTYTIFAELNISLVASAGCVGCIVPSGIATDDTTKFFFQHLITTGSLVSLYSFENEEFIFPNVHHSTRFCLLTTGGSLRARNQADFLFNARQTSHVADTDRHFELTAADIALLNPNTQTCPGFQSKREAELTKTIYRRVPILITEAREGYPECNNWRISFLRMFDMANDSKLFQTQAQLASRGFELKGNVFTGSQKRLLPLYEGKMFWQFDHRFGTYQGQTQAQANQGKLPEFDVLRHSNPELFSIPRYWVDESLVNDQRRRVDFGNYVIAFRDVTRAVVLRTAVFSVIPAVAVGHKAPLICSKVSGVLNCCLLGAVNSLVFDYVARQNVGGIALSYFILKQLPVPFPDMFASPANWAQNESAANWMCQRILELTYTAWDLEAFAQDCDYDGPPFRWNEERRFLLRCELDAAYFHLYLGASEEWGNDSPQLREMFPTPRHAVEYIMETFPIVKRKDIKRTTITDENGQVTQPGTYITKDTILSIYDAMTESIRTSIPYETSLDPAPGPPVDSEGNFISVATWGKSNWPRHIHPLREPAEKG